MPCAHHFVTWLEQFMNASLVLLVLSMRSKLYDDLFVLLLCCVGDILETD
jgi:hypothetical protein